MATTFTFRDARRILTLLEAWPEGHIRLVDGDLNLEATLDVAGVAQPGLADDGRITIRAPSVGIFRHRHTGGLLGIIEAPGREAPIETDHDEDDVEVLVEDGTFVAYGTPLAHVMV